ncbi:MAG: nucleotidyltransferase domain-containing protein [bacterium (Candidatus Stahlbacteria) CG08_land_8_20_14_0_20_40_26]|nr:MAG: DNA polymerase III subunit beta [bacterium (Candidatus Stahlbacteria) CG23_combo_of_CG06-09_8_20_14_all_40_9]PIS25378.1 MAG: nucleotidyltransferase domain-containing protein [bacterium (Candidatus Stahlbacteria) CG08_land_8_20_14_0_20_40_26]
MVKKEVIEKLKKFQRAIEKEGIKVEKIILYGSQVTGNFHKDSDIDVAIVSSDFGKDRFKEGSKLFQIAYKIDPRIEPVPVSLESYLNNSWVPLIYEIQKKGIEVKV